jgi:hypothetical protein
MDVFGFNYQPQDLWANQDRSRQFKVDGMTADEWVAAGKGTYDQFWHEIRPQQLQENFVKIWDTSTRSSNPASFPLDGVFKMLGSTGDKAILQTLDSMSQWERFADIQANGGYAVGFDLETFGDITKAGTDPAQFGITEFAIGKRIYDGTEVVKREGRSYIFGINDAQYNYLKGLNTKFQKSGWNSLEHSEQIALGRASMYAGEKAILDELIEEYGNQKFKVAGILSPETRTVSAINAGIENLHKAFKQSKHTPAELLTMLTKELVDASKEANTVLFGANSEFDINAIINAAKALGVDVDEIPGLRKQILDIVYSARAIAASNEQSVKASVDEQLKTARINSVQLHQGYGDIENEGRLLDIRVQEVLDSKEQLDDVKKVYETYPGIKDSVFLVHKGRLNQEHAQEMGIVNGEPVSNYSFTNEYWTVDEEHSHYIELDGEEKYALTLNNYVDGENTSVTIIRNSQEEAIEELVRNSSVFTTTQVTPSDAKGQRAFHYKDFGRREFDKVISPSSVAMDNGEDIYGYESLKKYLALADEVKDLDIKADGDSVNRIMSYIGENYADVKPGDRPIKSYYQAQAFAGMYEKIQNERPLLQNIVDRIEEQFQYQQAENIDKTIILRRAYSQTIEHLDEKYTRQKAGEFYNVMSDAMGVDVMMPDESIRRINAYSPESAASDIRRIFRNLNSQEIGNIVEELHDSGLLYSDQAEYTEVARRIAKMPSSDLYGLSQELGYELSRVTLDYTTRNRSIVHAFRNDSKTKNLQFLGQELETERIIKYKETTFAKAYAKHSDEIDRIISDAIKYAPDTVYLSTVGDSVAFKNYINKIASQLNIEQMPLEGNEKTGATLLYELFTKTKGYDGQETKYAINNYIDEGLSTFMAMGDNGNAYLFLTRQQDAARFYTKLLDGKFNLSSKNELMDPKNKAMFESINEYASFVEIPKINEYQLSEGVLRTVNQGNIEKVIIPQLNVSTNSKGQLRAYYNSGEFGYLSTLRMSMGGAIKHTLLGEYEAGSSAVRRAQNNYLDDLSSSASYRGRAILDTNGNLVEVRRIAEFTPSDFIQAHEANISDGLYKLFKGAVEVEPGKDLNVAQKIIMAFGERSGLEFDPRYDQLKYMYNIVEGTEFQEFFTKRLFTGTISGDTYLSGTLKGPGFDKNFFQILKDIANDETTHIFDKSVATALANIPTNQVINQVLSENALEKGIVSYGVRPGDYNDAASLYSTMRPTYSQQNNGMYYTVSEMDKTKFTGFRDGAPVRFDTAVIASKEYNDRMALANSGYNPIPGKDYGSRRRSMVARVKQMGDYELQLKYIEMQQGADTLAKELGISRANYDDALKYFQQNFMSLHEGKIFLAPGLNEQTLFQDREGKKILYDLDSIDKTRSRALLEKYVREKTRITGSTPIAIRANGAPIYYQGPEAYLTKANVKEFFDNGKSYVIPIQGDIFDNKVMINGAEKGTTHSINMGSFMKYTGITNYDEALRVANALFDRTFDGAAAVGNFGIEKHANIISTHSIWNTITSQYIENGYGEILQGHLNRLVRESDAFAGFGEFRFINGELISSSSNARNFSTAIEHLYGQIKTNSVLRSDINEKIVKELTDLTDKNSFNALLQRQSMNEQMGTRMVIDQRIEQGIRTRGMQMGGDGMQAIDNDWADMLKTYSQRYTARGTSLTGDLGEFIDIYGAAKNASRVHLISGKTDIQRSAKGIVESMMYYYNPTKYNPEGKNIVKININDLMDEGIRLKGGLSTKELHNSIFFVDGKPSEFLQEQARKSNVNLYNKSYSIFIDLNQTKFSITDKNITRSFSGVMIPIQSVFGDINDKTYFQSQQSTVAKFINKLTDITANPQNYKQGVAEALSSSYSDFIHELGKQLGYLDKDSDVYKAFQQYIMPTSQELLAQDEAAPLIKEMMNDEIKKLIQDKNKYEKQLIINADNKTAIEELDKVYKNLDTRLKAIGSKIRTDDSYYSDMMSLSTNKALREASKVTINGKTHYGLAIAISKEAFERQGISVGAVGLEAFQNWENKNYQLERIKEFSKNHDFDARRTAIAKKLNDLGIDGLHIDDSKPITEQIGNYIKDTYRLNDSMLTIKDLNKAMIEGRGPAQILEAFEDIGKLYLTEVGTFGELTSYPSFRSQPMVRVILDDTLKGKQIRGSSAVLSSLSNVDFDGDKQFLAMLTDGISVVNKGTTIKGKNVLATQQEIFNRFATTESRGLLAELIESGDVFKVDNSNATTRQYASMLKTMKPQVYEEAVMAWAKDNSIRVSSIDKLSEAQIYAASTSKQMHDAFINMKFNTMTDADSIVASIASRFRKKNIGSISTPNYHMRNALLEAMQDPAMLLHQKQLLNDTYVSLSNMLSKAGGFFSQAEQKSIDVKHAKDGLDIALTTRYSSGMSMLFGTDKHTVEKNIAGIRNILEATNSGLFKASNKELGRMATIVASYSKEQFSEAMKAYDGTTKEYLMTLRKLMDVQREIPNFDKIYANRLIKGTLDDHIFDVIRQIEELNAGNMDELAKRYVGTSFYNVLDIFADSFSADKPRFIENNIYFQVGDINGDWTDTAYLFNSGKFTQINMETGEAIRSGVNGDIKTLIDGVPGGVNFRDFTQSSALRQQVNETIAATKFERTLNSVLLDKKGNVLSKIPDNFIKVGNANGGIAKYGSVWNDVNNLLIGKQSQGRQTSAIYQNIAELGRTYNYAVAKGFIDTSKHPSSSGELIRQINKQIAENPKNHTGEYDTILRGQMSSIFGGNEVLDRYAQESTNIPVFDGGKYKKSLDFLKQNTYDIIEQQKTIKGSFASVKTELDGLRKQGVSDNELKILQNILDSSEQTTSKLLNKLREENVKVIGGIQQDIYGLFESTAQMESFFGWGRVADDTIVGFGDYIGKTFGELSSADVDAIMEAAEIARQSIDTMSAREEFAFTHTMDALENYKPHALHSARTAMKSADDVSDLLKHNQEVITALHEALAERTPEEVSEASKRAAENVQKKTLTGSLFTQAKESLGNIPKKNIAVAAGALAAIGVVNNLLHHDKAQSPLTPARRHDSSDSPSMTSPASGQAPMSKGRTIYHDKGTGFNFNVSAKTRNYINDQNNAKLIGMSGGGQASVYSQSDMSGVTNNWLANKFADLT